MNKIEIFKNSEFGEIETIMIDEIPYFKANDVCRCLGYSKPRNSIKRHVHIDDALFRGVTDSLGREQQSIFINESGLYSLIMRSKRKEAILFQRWVTSEVLPAIRKSGYYAMSQKHEAQLLKAKNHEAAQEQVARTLNAALCESKEEARIWREKAMELSELPVTVLPPDRELYTTKAIAEELGTNAQVLHKFLKEKGVIEKYGTAWTLCVKYLGQGIAKNTKAYYKVKKHNDPVSTETLKWSEIGRRFIYEIYKGISLDEIEGVTAIQS
ncbi:MAG: BRO family protein [Rikenellaceae bacterium]